MWTEQKKGWRRGEGAYLSRLEPVKEGLVFLGNPRQIFPQLGFLEFLEIFYHLPHHLVE
jgi:hypothetical protein